MAPRILNAPARCRFSHLRRTSTPITSESERLVSRGVAWIQGAILTAAARTSDRETERVAAFGSVTGGSISSCKQKWIGPLERGRYLLFAFGGSIVAGKSISLYT